METALLKAAIYLPCFCKACQWFQNRLQIPRYKSRRQSAVTRRSAVSLLPVRDLHMHRDFHSTPLQVLSFDTYIHSCLSHFHSNLSRFKGDAEIMMAHLHDMMLCLRKWLTPLQQTNEASHPSEKIFALPELFENVLLHMRIKDLLVNAQRVNRAWRDTINQSPKLKRALFFEPLPGRTVRRDHGDGPDDEAVWRREKSDIRGLIIQRNPFYDLLEEIGDRFFLDDDAAARAIRRRSASWRRMLVSQPPIDDFQGFVDDLDDQREAATLGGLAEGHTMGMEGDQAWMTVEYANEVFEKDVLAK